MNKGNEAILADSIYKGQAYGSLAARVLAANGDTKILCANTTLLKDEWKLMSDKIVSVAQERLIGVSDLITRGLFLNITNGLGKTVLETQTASDMEAAELNMDAIAATKVAKDRLKFDIGYLPLPIVSKRFDISARVLNASRSGSQPLDTRQAAIASRLVSEKIEEVLFTGASTYTFGGGVLYGYMDHINRVTGNLTANWDDSGADPVQDVINMKQKSINVKHHGPWILYVPTNFEGPLDEDYVSSYPSKTVRQRILDIGGIEDVKVADKLTADNVLLVEMSEDTVRMIIGLQSTLLQEEANFGMNLKFLVLAIMVPQIFADQDGNCGIVHYS